MAKMVTRTRVNVVLSVYGLSCLQASSHNRNLQCRAIIKCHTGKYLKSDSGNCGIWLPVSRTALPSGMTVPLVCAFHTA
jgi:hypothetical protein